MHTVHVCVLTIAQLFLPRDWRVAHSMKKKTYENCIFFFNCNFENTLEHN